MDFAQSAKSDRLLDWTEISNKGFSHEKSIDYVCEESFECAGQESPEWRFNSDQRLRRAASREGFSVL